MQSWDTPTVSSTVSNSWDTPAPLVTVSNSWDTPAPSAPDNSWDGQVNANNANSDTHAPAAPDNRDGQVHSTNTNSLNASRSTKEAASSGPVAPSEAQSSDDVRGTSAITPAETSWDTPAPVLTNQSWDAPTPAPATWDAPTPAPASWDAPTPAPASWDAPTPAPASWDAPTPAPNSWDAPTPDTSRPAEQSGQGWGAADASASDPQQLSEQNGPPNGTFSRKPPGIYRRNSRPPHEGSLRNRDYSDGPTDSATSGPAKGLGASRWAPSNRPQRRRFDGPRRGYEQDRGFFRSGDTNASGANGSWSTPSESGNNDRDLPGPAATGSNGWDLDAATTAAPATDWNTAPVSDNWGSDPVQQPNNVRGQDAQQDTETIPQPTAQPKAGNDTWGGSTPVVNNWGSPALAVDYRQNVVSAEVKENGPTPAPSTPGQPESNVVPTPGPSWAAAPAFVPRSFSATEQASSPDAVPPPPAESSGWDAQVPVPDNSWDAKVQVPGNSWDAPTVSNVTGTFSPVSAPFKPQAEPTKEPVPTISDPKPSPSKPTFEPQHGAPGALHQSGQPSGLSWDTPAPVAADNSWDTPAPVAVDNSWNVPAPVSVENNAPNARSSDTTPVPSAQDPGWDAPKSAGSTPRQSDSYSQSRTQGDAQNGWGVPTEPPSNVGRGLGGSKYGNGGGSYSNGSRGGHLGAYERRGGHRNNNIGHGFDYGNGGSYRQGPGNHQENERHSYGNRYGSHGGDAGLSQSDHTNGADNTDRASSVDNSNGASQSWDPAPAPAPETSEKRAWGAPMLDTAESWDIAPAGAGESWDAPAGAGKW
ncbi:hypothetical protein V1525DRAFT_127408 [Lipomyces kononenkoae]|uniref:Uncharacterized protein n=1 Tax=Lipomyces kononenkoae TaxID=34357 RepID=A0ACC3T2E6_LIPKO